MAKKAQSLKDVLDSLIVYAGEEGDIEWTLSEIQEDASWDIAHLIIGYLNGLKVEVPKPVFGSYDAIKAATRNNVIDELIEIIAEGE